MDPQNDDSAIRDCPPLSELIRRLTQYGGQGPDIGTQYPSAIFAPNDEQLVEAKVFKREKNRSERLRGGEDATIVGKAGQFCEAEDYHQDYHARHGGSCSIESGE
jgi:peptide-methionine (S)-S-oxide reductase